MWAAMTAKEVSMMTFEKVTMFHVGVFGTTKTECSRLKLEEKPYAQYPVALHVTYVPKGARKERGFVKTKLTLAVVAGHGHPEPETFRPTEGGGHITRFASFASEWYAVHAEFIAKLKESGVKVLYETGGEVEQAVAS